MFHFLQTYDNQMRKKLAKRQRYFISVDHYFKEMIYHIYIKNKIHQIQ